ncbi:hypothetical protein J2847_004105 [Azospirillum agricola]|uniref:hypothetical protein n=1 Tax=Azospirillum agricola TaxID=1720247 RepID=UPI001F2FDAC7|nr:hypothetical protein [Azospirillum agricola]MBP2230796.1 hypothetical protein [Azospirillum agricola]
MHSFSFDAPIRLADFPVASGPLEGLLTAARDALCASAEQVGVTLWINPDMEGLLEVNARAMVEGSWDAILPAASPRCRKLDASNAYWIDGRSPEGETVTVQAGLLYDCRERSLGQRFVDLTVFYDEPTLQAPAGEWCEVSSEAALGLGGRVVWTNAGWTHPDWRRGKRGLFKTAQRANKLASWLLWQPDAMVSVVEPHIVPVWAEKHMGIRYMDPETTITYHQIGNGTFPMHFVLFNRSHFFGDLAMLAMEEVSAVA